MTRVPPTSCQIRSYKLDSFNAIAVCWIGTTFVTLLSGAAKPKETKALQPLDLSISTMKLDQLNRRDISKCYIWQEAPEEGPLLQNSRKSAGEGGCTLPPEMALAWNLFSVRARMIACMYHHFNHSISFQSCVGVAPRPRKLLVDSFLVWVYISQSTACMRKLACCGSILVGITFSATFSEGPYCKCLRGLWLPEAARWRWRARHFLQSCRRHRRVSWRNEFRRLVFSVLETAQTCDNSGQTGLFVVWRSDSFPFTSIHL